MQKRHIVTHSEGEIVLRTLSLTLPSGFEIKDHAHAWAQLIYATGGVMTVTTGEGSWVIPPERAVWAPASVTHSIVTTGAVTMRTLYCRPGFTDWFPAGCRVLGVSPLLRELILRAVELGHLSRTVEAHERLVGVIGDELRATGEIALDLRFPSDPRARRVAERVVAEPGSAAPLEALAQGSGASPRTIERSFQRELGVTFGKWRQRAKLLEALRLLASGASVSAAASGVGYESASAFIAMFKRSLGTTPRRYYEAGGASSPAPVEVERG